MKFAARIHHFITFKSIPSTCDCLWSFPPNKIENLTHLSSITSAQKGEGGGVVGGQRIEFNMVLEKEWNPQSSPMRL